MRTDPCDRLLRCIARAAGADEQRVRQLVELARQDYRDVIVAGEYDAAMCQVRDLRASFLLDNPEKFWAGEVVCLMASRGYQLIALVTQPANVGPFDYTSDYGEGHASFIGPLGEITIEKKDLQWMVHGNRRDLAAHEMDQPFNIERVFRDSLSGYCFGQIARLGFPGEICFGVADRRRLGMMRGMVIKTPIEGHICRG